MPALTTVSNVRYTAVKDRFSYDPIFQIGNAGFNLRCGVPTVVGIGERAVVPLGIKLGLPNDCYLRLTSRKDLYLQHGVEIKAGEVDPGFKGELTAIVFNGGCRPFQFMKGETVCIGIIEKIYIPQFMCVEKL